MSLSLLRHFSDRNIFLPPLPRPDRSFGRSRLVYHSLTNEVYAMKSLSKKLIVRYRQENHMRHERLLMNKISHPFCSRLIKSFNEGSHVHLVTEFSPGGELFHLLDRQEGGQFDESQAKLYAACVILVLEHLHSKGIIYRDLKPDNLMLDTECKSHTQTEAMRSSHA